MHTFSLRYEDDGLGEAETVEFDCQDAAAIFEIAAHQRIGRIAELWEGNRYLRTIHLLKHRVWRISLRQNGRMIARPRLYQRDRIEL